MTSSNLQQIQKTETLTNAFRIFNQLSENLANSYQGLEEQVAQLNRELAAARSERVSTLIEKEKLAWRLQQILAALPAGVVVVNALGQVIDCNHHALGFLGEPLLGENWQVVLLRSLPVIAGSPGERQLADGRKVNVTGNSLTQNAEQILLISDVSELRTLQDQLAQQKHLTAMGEMVAGLAHQVRTPLATAVLYASQIDRAGLSEEKRRQFARNILERLHYLERQVNDMLIFAKQGRFSMQNFALQDLLMQIDRQMERFAGSFEIENRLPALKISGNQDALHGALLNLLNNAMEAGAETISLLVDVWDEDSICFTLTDNGPGMDEACLSRLFEPFFTTKQQGTGLGLAVVESVVQAHGGSISCHSQPNCGASFKLTIPCPAWHELAVSTVEILKEDQHEAI